VNIVKSFAIIGGDARQIYMKQNLEEQGYEVSLCCFENYRKDCSLDIIQADIAVGASDAVILPIPASRDSETLNAPFSASEVRLSEIFDLLRPEQTVFAGMLGSKRRSELFRKGIRVYDYADRDEFAVKNAVPTAEGVVKIASEKLPITIKGANIAITGYGRTAKAAAKALLALGANVTVAARRCSSLASAENDGCRAIYLREMHRFAGGFDMLVNTVPAPVIDETILKKMRRDCVVADIASAPYGVDFEAAKALGLDAFAAGSLPGAIAPKSAGIIIGETIMNIIREGSE
jgi:dipicolinate synthase subunit A